MKKMNLNRMAALQGGEACDPVILQAVIITLRLNPGTGKECTGEKTFFKKIEHSMDKPLYDKMHQKMQTEYAKRIMKIRSSTVEPVLGTLLNFLNMNRVNTRGIKQANKHVLMAALTYNLKKYLRFIQRKSVVKANALYTECSAGFKTAFFDFIGSIIPKSFLPLSEISFLNLLSYK